MAWQWRNFKIWSGLLSGGLLGLACSKAPLVGQSLKPTPVKAIEPAAATPDPSAPAPEVKPGTAVKIPAATSEFALAFLKDNCASCHGQGKPYFSFWGYEGEDVTVETLKLDLTSPSVYQAMRNKYQNIPDADPAPMPAGGKLTAENNTKLGSVVSWFEATLPTVVADARQTYHYAGKPEDSVAVNLNFKCEKPATFRSYLIRLTQDAFTRQPRQSDFDAFASVAPDPDLPTTKEMRDKVGEHFATNPEWKTEFMGVGLKKFSSKISGVTDIHEEEEDGANKKRITEDLKEEFYQTVKRNYETMSFKDMLLSDSVFVSKYTGPLYGSSSADCPHPTDDVSWAACKMAAPRGSFFTTHGFLRSKKSSFLEANNNYGRAAVLQFVLSGELFKAATSGPKGEAVAALPGCFKSNDYRGTPTADGFAPIGTSKIPASGNVCQSCHINRNLASGSILFRPFSATGRIFKAFPEGKSASFAEEDIGNGNPHTVLNITQNRQVINADNSDSRRLDFSYFNDLLTAGKDKEQACIVGRAGRPDVILNGVKDLAKNLIGDESILVKGLSRHLPRSLSNVPSTNQEIIERLSKAYVENKDKKGMLAPLFKAYFTSETYACEKRN